MARNNADKGDMSVKEAGQKGGRKTSETQGREFYTKIGQKGGDRVRELVERGKENESE